MQTAFQEMTLVRDLTVLDNMLLPYAPVGVSGLIRARCRTQGARHHIDDLRFFGSISTTRYATLELSVRQKIEIARAVYRKPRILLLDEPTSTLAGRDVDWLGEIIDRRKAAGATIVFITHRMREVRAFCDTLTILRNGRHIVDRPVAESQRRRGDRDDHRPLASSRPFRRGPPRSGCRACRFWACATSKVGAQAPTTPASTCAGARSSVSPGLQGMGQQDLFLACFGMAEIDAAAIILVDGRPV